MALTPQRAYPVPGEVWTILVEEAGAVESDRPAFVHHWPACVEYRFVGKLGMGGKVWANMGDVYVTCYPEDHTREREQIIAACNGRLAALPR